MRSIIFRVRWNGWLCKSFLFGKFKNCLDSFESNSFQVSFGRVQFSSFSGVLFKPRGICLLWVAAILLPCLVDASPVFWGEVGLKDVKGFKMIEIIVMQKSTQVVLGISTTNLGIVLQEDYLGEKSVLEPRGCFVELNNFDAPERGSSIQPITDNGSGDAYHAANNCSQESSLSLGQVFLISICGSLGLSIVLFPFIYIFFRYT